MPAKLSQFAELCQRLAETGSKLEKRALMAEYLRALPVPEGRAGGAVPGRSSFSGNGRARIERGRSAAEPRPRPAFRSRANPQCMPPTCAMATWAARPKTFCKREASTATLLLPEVAEAFAAIAGAGKPAAKQQSHAEPCWKGPHRSKPST